MTEDQARLIAAQLIDQWSQDLTLSVGVPYRRMASDVAALLTRPVVPAETSEELWRLRKMREAVEAKYLDPATSRDVRMALAEVGIPLLMHRECELAPAVVPAVPQDRE